jgi:CRP/FNR family transcriptional regulator, cyclic AMP receptor protein
MEQQQAAGLLARTTIFEGLPEQVLRTLVAQGIQRRYAKNQFLCYQGDPGDRLFVVLSGLVKVTVSSDQGEEMVLVTLGPPQVLGELALLDGAPRSAAIQALEPTDVLMLPRDTFLRLLHEHPALTSALLNMLGGLIRRLTEQAADLVFLDLHGRVAKLLLRLATERGTTENGLIVLDHQLTQTDIARMVGGSRPAVNRILQAFASREFLEIRGQRIVIRQLEALRRRAGLQAP